jgi:hypothetical protein
MAGRIRDDELAPGGREEAVSDIDGDALLPLRCEPVDKQGEVDALVACRAVPALFAE